MKIFFVDIWHVSVHKQICRKIVNVEKTTNLLVAAFEPP